MLIKDIKHKIDKEPNIIKNTVIRNKDGEKIGTERKEIKPTN